MSQQYSKRKRFRPDTTVFHSSSKINTSLLENIVDCYQKGHPVCKYCYYRKQFSRPVAKVKDGQLCSTCNNTNCVSVWLMPASQYCSNFFGITDKVPIPSAPKWSLDKANKPFGICSRTTHQSCFEMSATAAVWFAHTIEELVIWTIEREYNCSFQQYIDIYYHGNPRKIPPAHAVQKSIIGKVGKSIIKDHDLNTFSDSDDIDEILDPNRVSFECISDIPEHLIQSVCDNYKMAVKCCRYCYYYNTKVSSVKEENNKGYWRCKECKRKWNYINVIPASKFCKNFGNFKSVSISIPATGGPESGPHYYCNRDDHYRCFEKYAENGLKYAHSIEELVVWTVEKRIGYGNFSKFIQDRTCVINEEQVKAISETNQDPSDHKYLPSRNMIHTISGIPRDLLASICECYKRRFNTCRACFFESLEDNLFNDNPTLSSKEEGSNMCERGHYWKPIRAIPACQLCESYGTIIAISPFPIHMIKNKAPFQVCNYRDHNVCFVKSREINPWFPHTMEEIIIWTVERETGKDFANFCKDYMIEKPPERRNIITVGEIENNIIPEIGTVALVKEDQSHYQYETEAKNENENESSPLLFVDEESDEEIVEQNNNPLYQKDKISLTDFFPALNGSDPKNTAVAVQPSSNSFLTQIPPAVAYPISHQVPPALPILQSLPPPFPNSIMTPSLAPPTKQERPIETTGRDIVLMSEDEDIVTYECYLCYREFVSAKRLANHSTKQSHIDIMKSDLYYKRLWRYYPYPPDQVPDDFTLCTRSSNCPGRVKCCRAHSMEEREEWIVRYNHRMINSNNFKGDTPMDVISKCNRDIGVVIQPNTESSQSISVSVTPTVLQHTVKRIPEWKITVCGQGWQTLLGIECVSIVKQNEQHNDRLSAAVQFIISSIKGDTIYTICPRNRLWVAPLFDEGILLGSIVVSVKPAELLAVGSHDCHVKLHLGLHKYIRIDLQAVITSV